MNLEPTPDIQDTFTAEDLDRWFEADDSPDFIAELNACALDLLRDHPGIDREQWIDLLLLHYPAEVIDAFGPDEGEVETSLHDLWHSDYQVPETGECHTFATWSEHLKKYHQ